MAKPKGSQKTGGRSLGTPNKRTLVLLSVTEALGLDVPRQLHDLLPKLEAGKQADVLLDLMSYIYPRRKAIEHSGPEGAPLLSHSPVVVVLPAKRELLSGYKD